MLFAARSIVIAFFAAVFYCTLQVDAQYRIVGGTDVQDDEYVPYQISLQVAQDNGRKRHFCGGSIVSPRLVLTAAHCVKGIESSVLSVVAGVRDLNATGQRSQVVSYEIHPDYKELVTGDVAILYVNPRLKLDGKTVDKIEVTGKDTIPGGATLMITGWGSVNPKRPVYPIRLQKLIYKSITNEECKPYMSNLTNSEMCARGTGEGSCIGDSGGPLVMRAGSHLVQVGLVSYGSTTCANEMPDVYTRVSAFADWIASRIV